jgi:hypothetical protein
MSDTPETTPSQPPADPNRGDNAAWRAYGAYTWWNRFSTFGDLMAWLFKTKSGLAVATGVVGAAAVGTVAVVAPDLLSSRAPRSEAVVERLADASTVYTIDGVDAAGRKATFEMLVVAEIFTWVRGSSTQLMKQGEPLDPSTTVDEVFGPDIRARLARSGELIAAGAASEEGAVDIETKRAEERSRLAATWLAVVEPGKPVWTLNLGQYKSTCEVTAPTGDTSWQRPLIVIGVRAQERGVVLAEALANAMSNKTNVPSPSCYTSFVLARGAT